MEEKVIYVPYKLSGLEREMFCDYCDCHLNELDEVYCKFYQNEDGQVWFERITCPDCFKKDKESERLQTEVIPFILLENALKKAILQSIFCECHF